MTQTHQTVLIVDDEPDICTLLEITLTRLNLKTRVAHNLAQARQQLQQEDCHLCLTDMHLPDGNGLDFINEMQQNHPQTPVAMITAYGNVETAIGALKAGAFDFLTKPIDLARLRALVHTALRLEQGTPSSSTTATEHRLIGQSEPMQRLRQQIAKLARSQAPVYISGASGTGKELVARSIHEQGPRSTAAFVPVNCGAIPSELMESEFFGHRKGSFTGAGEEKRGLFQAAQGGTLFLDEVADLPMAMQVKLLRAIQEKAIRPIGSTQEVAVDVRILCATHKDLALEVHEGRFRQDLYYRLNVIELSVPALCQRRTDIPSLVSHIVQRLAKSTGQPVAQLQPEALHALQNYAFPGNVRELENILERAYTLCEAGVIRTQDLSLPETAASTPLPPTAFANVQNLEEHLESIERTLITQALEETRWNRTAAAQRLGLTFRSLRYRLKKLGLD